MLPLINNRRRLSNLFLPFSDGRRSEGEKEINGETRTSIQLSSMSFPDVRSREHSGVKSKIAQHLSQPGRAVMGSAFRGISYERESQMPHRWDAHGSSFRTVRVCVSVSHVLGNLCLWVCTISPAIQHLSRCHSHDSTYFLERHKINTVLLQPRCKKNIFYGFGGGTTH